MLIQVVNFKTSLKQNSMSGTLFTSMRHQEMFLFWHIEMTLNKMRDFISN